MSSNLVIVILVSNLMFDIRIMYWFFKINYSLINTKEPEIIRLNTSFIIIFIKEVTVYLT